MMRAAILLSFALLAGAMILLLAGCGGREQQRAEPEKSASFDPAAVAKKYADGTGKAVQGAYKSTETFALKTGEKLGLVKLKPVDYVRKAWEKTESPATLRYTYSPADERAIGQALALEFIGRHGHYAKDDVERYITLVGAALAAYSPQPDLPVSPIILRSEQPVVQAAPGGFVLISLGALRLCDSEGDLAGFMAGAIAQIELKHHLALIESLQGELDGMPTGHSIAHGEAKAFTALIEAAANRLSAQGLPQAHLVSGDRLATDLLLRLGYEAGALKAYLLATKRHADKSGGLTAHEQTVFDARCKAIEERVAELQAPGTGRTHTSRYRKRCIASLPAPALAP